MADTDRQTSVSRDIMAPPEEVFAILANPARHADIDGSGTVQGERVGPERLELGSRFGMKMKMYGMPYRMTSTVVEYDDNRLIAWAHAGGHRWRYELEPIDGETRVTETFDWSTARSPWFIEKMGYPDKHRPNMEATLERLDTVATTSP